MWFHDQYKHPHESKHSIDETLSWFEKCGIEPLTSIPMVGSEPFSEDTRLFAKHSMGSRIDRIAAQLAMLLEGGSDGGLFIMIGRKLDRSNP